tara:strand:- start:1029 stop:1913 length:885 start_codon:yes stop_codon:yes gene_type:complete
MNVLLLLLASLSPLEGVETEAARKAYMRETVIGVDQIIAHRGASVERPECTLSSIERAIQVGATAVEVDIRTTKDGALVIMHDATVDRTTDGSGQVNELTLAEIQKLDAGSWFSKRFRGEPVPTLQDVLETCKGRIDVVLDLKEYGDQYRNEVVRQVRQYGEPERMIIGVRSMAHIETFSELLPEAILLGLISNPSEIEQFVENGVKTIRIWPKWFEQYEEDLIRRVRLTGGTVHLNGTLGKLGETYELLQHFPVSLSSDDPKLLIQNLRKIKHGTSPRPDKIPGVIERNIFRR